MADSPGDRSRDRLVEEHWALVQRLANWARGYARSIGLKIDHDDLAGLAQEGLLRAAESFDLAKGVPFGSYAWLRVMGHIKDALRDEDYLTRRERQLVQAWRRGNELDDRRMRQAARLASQRPATWPPEQADFDVPGDNRVEGTALAHAQAQEIMGLLPPVERAVLGWRYLDGLSISAIGALLYVSESWVSQVHKSALRRLRRAYEPEAS